MRVYVCVRGRKRERREKLKRLNKVDQGKRSRA